MWDQKYSAEHYIYGTEPNHFLEKNFSVIPAGKVLCLAEGEGRNAVFLAQQGYAVTAVDSSSVGLEKARRLADKNGVSIEIVYSDLAEYDLGERQWDGVVSIFCHIPEQIRKQVHRRVVNALKDDGILLLEAYTPDQLQHRTGGPQSEDMMYSASRLRNELEGLQFDHLVELERNIIEGTKHTGMGAVVQAIARK